MASGFICRNSLSPAMWRVVSSSGVWNVRMSASRATSSSGRNPQCSSSSRGEVVDGDALLRSGLRWALDVWEHEPNLNPQLLEKALLATPHIAGYSEQGKANATAMSVAALARCFGLPLEGWYPPEASPSAPRPIAWQELCSTIGEVYDIEAESRRLKRHPGDFESLRDHYAYRREYF